MIDVENLRLSIGDKEILKGIDLHLQPGDVYGVVGEYLGRMFVEAKQRPLYLINRHHRSPAGQAPSARTVVRSIQGGASS